MKRVSLLLLLAACVYEPVLVPDTNARTVGDHVAVTQVQGVQMAVDGTAWRGEPMNLPELLTPVHISIDNLGQVPLRLTYRDFGIAGETGMRYTAIPPLQAQVPNSQRDTAPGAIRLSLAAYPAAPQHVAPRFHHHHFYVAPYYGWYYPGYPTWAAPFPYEYYGPYSWPQQLPSQDMIAEALPEGVLQPGGHVDGFLYFQGVYGREEHVRFDMRLVDANSGATVGTAYIPLRVVVH
jgi:hypothetical protein